jgi:hypothetical protein
MLAGFQNVMVECLPCKLSQVISMPLSETIKTLIRNAWDDGYPCLLATNGPQGPNITPKGSMIVFDDALSLS